MAQAALDIHAAIGVNLDVSFSVFNGLTREALNLLHQSCGSIGSFTSSQPPTCQPPSDPRMKCAHSSQVFLPLEGCPNPTSACVYLSLSCRSGAILPFSRGSSMQLLREGGLGQKKQGHQREKAQYHRASCCGPILCLQSCSRTAQPR